MHFDDDDIAQIVTDIWTSMLGLPLEQVDSGVPEDGTTVSACVQITGEWAGAVVVHVPIDLAVTIAATMFGLEPDEAEEEMVHDAVGEMANMAGGNVKTLVPGHNALSLPAVSEGRSLHVTVPGSTVVNHVGFACDGQPFSVTVVGREQNAAA